MIKYQKTMNRNFLNVLRSLYNPQLTSYSVVKDSKAFLNTRSKARMLAFMTAVQYGREVQARALREQKQGRLSMEAHAFNLSPQ